MNIIFDVLLLAAIIALIIWPETALILNELVMRAYVWFKNIREKNSKK